MAWSVSFLRVGASNTMGGFHGRRLLRTPEIWKRSDRLRMGDCSRDSPTLWRSRTPMATCVLKDVRLRRRHCPADLRVEAGRHRIDHALRLVPDIIMFYGAAHTAFTQFPVQTLAVLTATRTIFCSTTCC